jgi:hypothetical protein
MVGQYLDSFRQRDDVVDLEAEPANGSVDRLPGSYALTSRRRFPWLFCNLTASLQCRCQGASIDIIRVFASSRGS